MIRTISEMNYEQTPYEKGIAAISNYISNITHDNLQRERDEVLSSTQYDIRKFAVLLSYLIKENCYCVYGNKGYLEDNTGLFDKMISVE